MKIGNAILAVWLALAAAAFAAGGADYGRGPETDPVGVAAAASVSIFRVARLGNT